MNIMDSLQASVLKSVNSKVHGRSAMGYLNASDTTGFAFNVIVKPDSWRSVFDTGTDSIDFDAMPAIFCSKDVALTPEQVGRGSTGFRLVFDDVPGVTWYVRNVAASAEYVGGYYDVSLTNYNGPINGV
jgi:hypothetical protein